MKRAIAVCLLLAVLLSMAGCGKRQEAAAEMLQTEITEPSAEPVTEPAPTEPAAEPEILLHSGIREDGSFNEHTLFLGDSLTYGLVEHELKVTGRLGEARYAGKCGAHVGIYGDGTLLVPDDRALCYFSEEFRGMTVPEAAEAMGGDAWAIYYMFGTNYDRDGSAQDYIEVFDSLLEVCPNATIYLQTVPQGDVAWRTINGRIREAYAHYADQPRVQLLDVGGTIGRHIVNDGVHQTPLGRQLWVEAILAYAEENQIGE